MQNNNSASDLEIFMIYWSQAALIAIFFKCKEYDDKFWIYNLIVNSQNIYKAHVAISKL